VNAKGHLGMGLPIVFGVLSLLKLSSVDYMILGLITVTAVTLPDIDIRLEIAHRKYENTHIISQQE